MLLTDLLILILVTLVLRFGLGLRPRSRGLILMLASILVIFWLQPVTSIRFLDFWMPVATLFITIGSWLLTAEPDQKKSRSNLITLTLVTLTILLIALTRYLGLSELIGSLKPPQFGQVLIGTAILLVFVILIARFSSAKKAWLMIGIIFLLTLFVILKTPPLALAGSTFLRSLVGQSLASASPLDIRWLGFSYVAFRLIHTLRDRMSGRMPQVSLQDYLTYVIFFPAFSAGPIDRLPRFIKDLQEPLLPFSPQLGQAFYRLTVGIFKKFALADSLALLALNAQNASQLQSTGFSWLMVYAYAFLIYFDFSGYADIAIGLGQLLGITLPDNFNRPYLKPNLTQFWNNWHITLTQWFRAYFFNPFTRSLRSKYRGLNVGWIVLITQLSTMILIGLWHGVAWNFVLWGLWHGLGLFVNNRFSDWVKPRLSRLQTHTRMQRSLDAFNTVLTFHFVALGWIWFALPSVPLSLNVFTRLFGLGS